MYISKEFTGFLKDTDFKILNYKEYFIEGNYE